MSKTTKTVSVPAIRYTQGASHTLYTFVMDGKQIADIAKADQLTRTEEGLTGFQRLEVGSHVAEIRTFIDSGDPMIPNAVVLAFVKPLQFRPAEAGATVGTLAIPLGSGLTVDGQQRLAAIRDAAITSFPITVVAFVANSEDELREHFVRVNSAKPLPKGLILEMLPSISGTLPKALETRKLPALLCERLNSDTNSPLRGLIRTQTNPDGIVKDNTVIRAIEDSLSDGCLFYYRDPLEIESMLEVLKAFWGGVAITFRDSWAKPLNQSRLFHASGFVGLGYIMDAIYDSTDDGQALTRKMFAEEVALLKPYCAWTEGTWDFGPDGKHQWNDLQNTAKDIRVFVNFLVRTYRALKKTEKKGGRKAG